MVKTSRSRSPSPTGLVKDDPNVGSTPRHPLHRSHSSLTPSSFSFISRPTQQSLSQKLKTALPFSRFYSNTLTVTTASDPLLPSLLTEHGSLFHLPQPIVLSSSTTRPRYPSGKLSLTHPRFHADLPESTTAPISKYTATISRRRRSVDALNIVHDVYRCMFKVTLDTKGSLAALCYLPTRHRKMVEFYHTEIPPEFRHQGVGDLLVKQGFQWAEESNLLVIPTCTFVKRHIEWSGQRRACIVRDEEEGTLRLQNNHSKSDQK